MRSRWVHVLRVGLAVVVVAGVYGSALPRLGSYQEVWPMVSSLSRSMILLLAVLGLINLLSPAATQAASLPGLTLRQALTSDLASTAIVNVVPAGSAGALALQWSMYRRWGLDQAVIARGVVVTGVLDTAVKLGTPALAVLLLFGRQDSESTNAPDDRLLIQAAVIGAILVVAAAIAIAVFLRRTAAPATMTLLRDRGPRLAMLTLIGHSNLFLLLLVSLRGVGVEPAALSAAGVFSAFAFGRLVTAIPLTPGGLGVMDLGLAASLGQVGSATSSQIVAGVLLCRFLTYAVPIPLGMVAGLLLSPKPRIGSE